MENIYQALDLLRKYLDDHRDQEVVVYVHMVDGEYRHEVEIREKPVGEWRK